LNYPTINKELEVNNLLELVNLIMKNLFNFISKNLNKILSICDFIEVQQFLFDFPVNDAEVKFCSVNRLV